MENSLTILKQNILNLDFFHHTGVCYLGVEMKSGWIKGSKYNFGCIVNERGHGACGALCAGGPVIPPYTTKQLYNKEPDSFMVVISFISGYDINLYENIKNALEKYTNKEDQTEVLINQNTQRRRVNLGLIDKYASQAEDIFAKNKEVEKIYDEKLKKFYKFLKEFETLGCDINECDIGKPKLISVPDNWYKYDEEVILGDVAIIIFGRNNSKIQKDFIDLGLIR